MKQLWDDHEADQKEWEYKHEKIESKVCRYARLLEKATEEEKKHWRKKPGYIDVLNKMCELIKVRLNCKDYKVLGPFGVECDFGLWFYDDTEKMSQHPRDLSAIKYSLNVKPANHSRGLLYWNGVILARYPKGSIADLSGLNYEWEHLPESIDEIVEIIRKLKTNGVQ